MIATTKYIKILLSITALSVIPMNVKADMKQGIGSVTSLPIPRFVSTKSKPSNVRTGPGRRYPIRITFSQRVPVQIIDEYQDWRKVQDWQGEQGWIHKALLSSRRLGLIENTTALYKTDKPSGVRAKLGENVIVRIDTCDSKWCYVNVMNVDVNGYIDQRQIWGLKDSEIIK